MSGADRASMTRGPVGRQLAAMSVSMTWGLLATMAAQLFITWLIGRLGPNELAAASFTFPVAMLLINLGVGLGAGTSAAVARAIGGGEGAAVARLTTDALLLTAGAVGAMALLGLATIDPLFRLLGADPAVLALIGDYMRVWYIGAVPFMVAMVGLTATRAAGRANFQAYAMVASAVLSMALAPPLIFGMFGLPRLGLAGAALATVGAAVPVLVAALWRLRRDGMLVFDLPSRDQFLASAARILHVALPAAATNIIIPAATMIVTAILAAFGTGAIAAFGVATRIESVAMIGFFALSAVMNPFCGQNAGAHRTARIRRAITLSTLFCLGLGAVLAPLLFVSAPWLVGIFTTDREVARIAVAYLRIVPVSYGAAGLITVVNAAFNGLGRPAAAVAVSLARMVAVNIPVAWLGGRLFGVEGVFLGIAVANITVGLAATLWLRRTIQEPPSEAPAGGADRAPVRS